MSTSTAFARIDLVKRPSSIPPPPALVEARQAKPFIKWVGGKGRLLPQLTPLLPPGVERMRHVEPFVGGGAFFFARSPARALLSDVNPNLIGTYEAIRDDVEGVMGNLEILAAGHSKEAYYGVRTSYNLSLGDRSSERAAQFIYLNKTCFNGLHRVNKKGEFNVPAGRYVKPRILDESALLAAHRALQKVEIRCAGFEALVQSARPGDFVYFDPPYEPVSDTARFTAYAKGGFGQDAQRKLRDVFRELDRRGARLMLSNSDVPFIRDLYSDFRIDTVAAPRAINCNGRGRGKVSEVVVRNY
jgi:DNA adenine methylase